MEIKLTERLIKEIVIESNNLLECVQWNNQEIELDKLKLILSSLMHKCETLKEKIG